MINTLRSRRGMVTSPHHLASQSGLAVLREGGNAIEAMVATAATLSVAYPHMIGIGGDAFWLVAAGDADPIAIDACGATGAKVDRDLYRGHAALPERGPLSANSVAGAVSGWMAALELSRQWGGRMPLARLLEDAIHYAEAGLPVSNSQHEKQLEAQADLAHLPGFAEAFIVDGKVPPAGALLRQPALGRTLRRLVEAGLEDFYRGDTARAIGAEMARIGGPITADDLARHTASRREPLSLRTSRGRLFNFPPPTQGLASLIILGIFDRLAIAEADGFDHIHGLVEATKQAYRIRNAVIVDPAYMKARPQDYLTEAALDRLAGKVDRRRAAPWQSPPDAGDTAWMGAIDGEGRAVSHIQSIFFPFGSGVVLADTGILWHNRGSGFSVDPASVNPVMPGRKPFHTLNPAMARLAGGRLVTYGTMGGQGQPQFQSAVMSRYAWFDQPPQQAVTAPRWMLDGLTADGTAVLLLESRAEAGTVAALRDAGHDVRPLAAFSSTVGHSGMIVRQPDGTLEGAADPRSDGVLAAF